MTKYFCDRCGKECGKLYEIKIPKEKNAYGSILTEAVHVCGDCEKKHDEIISKLTDIRFILFADFMKGGAE